MQSRLIVCINYAGTEILDISKCPQERPKDYKVCSREKCTVDAEWETGPWGKVRTKFYHSKKIYFKFSHDQA